MFLPSSEEDFSMSSDASIEENKIDFAKKKVFKKKKSEVRKEPSEFQPCCSKSLQAVDFEENAELLEERTQEPENFVPGEDSRNRLEDMQSENEAEIVHPIEHLWKAPVGAHKIFEYSSENGLNAGYAAVLINELSPYIINVFVVSLMEKSSMKWFIRLIYTRLKYYVIKKTLATILGCTNGFQLIKMKC